jgi:PilZ domain
VVGLGQVPDQRASVLNCSRGGVLLRVPSPARALFKKLPPVLHPSDSVTCVLRMPPTYQEIEVFAEVVRVTRPRNDQDNLMVGLRFFYDVSRRSHNDRHLQALNQVLGRLGVESSIESNALDIKPKAENDEPPRPKRQEVTPRGLVIDDLDALDHAHLSSIDVRPSRRLKKTSARVAKQSARVSKQSARASKQTARVPKQSAHAPNQSDRDAKQSARAPKQSDRASKQTARVPKQSDRTAKQSDRASKQTARVPKQSDRASKQSDRASKQTARVPKQSARVSKHSDRNGKQSAEQQEAARSSWRLQAQREASQETRKSSRIKIQTTGERASRRLRSQSGAQPGLLDSSPNREWGSASREGTPAPQRARPEARKDMGSTSDVVSWARARLAAIDESSRPQPVHALPGKVAAAVTRQTARSPIPAEHSSACGPPLPVCIAPMGSSELHVRGQGRLVDGRVRIELPARFAREADPRSLTSHVTPTSDCAGLYVAWASPTQLQVRELNHGRNEVTFDYLICAQRKRG